ncbi:hypothetical protein N9C31_04770, partial [Gammaproteobacteria bacterium]|nr:hypothetical protein [Gammaproteobacteria bacterium]
MVLMSAILALSPSKVEIDDNSKVEIEDNCVFLEKCQAGSLEDIKSHKNQSLDSIKSAIPLVVNSKRSMEDIRLIIDYFKECYPQNNSDLEGIIQELKVDPYQVTSIKEPMAVSNKEDTNTEEEKRPELRSRKEQEDGEGETRVLVSPQLLPGRPKVEHAAKK